MADLGTSAVHAAYVFVDDVSPELARARLWPLLDAEERRRHGRFRFDTDRHLYLVAHGLCRSVLSEYTGIAPQALRFTTRQHGKPVLRRAGAGAPPCFNLSHTRGLAAVAVARHEIGVDVERVDRRVELESVARRVFSETELADLMALRGERRRRRFFDYWTLKEAYVKALGDGLGAPLRDITIALGADAPPRLSSPHEAGPVWLRLEAPSSDHALALALRAAPPAQLRVRPWSPASP